MYKKETETVSCARCKCRISKDKAFSNEEATKYACQDCTIDKMQDTDTWWEVLKELTEN